MVIVESWIRRRERVAEVPSGAIRDKCRPAPDLNFADPEEPQICQFCQFGGQSNRLLRFWQIQGEIAPHFSTEPPRMFNAPVVFPFIARSPASI